MTTTAAGTGGAMKGMDTEAGRAAGTELQSGADRITGLAQDLDAVLLGLEWTGQDAERVRASWQDQERPFLDTTAEHLRGLGALLAREAGDQDRASGETTGTGGGGLDSAGPAAPRATDTDGDLGDWITSHVGAFLQGAGRTLDSAGDLAGKIGDVLTGERDWSLASIAASAITTAGSAVGATVNGITGEDQHWFDERPGEAGTPVAVPTDPAAATQFQPALTQPTDLPSLMQGVSDGYQVGYGPDSTGDVRITRVDNGSGPAYVVAVPGTETWSPSAGDRPRDLSANLALVSGGPSAAAESVERALAQAGVPEGAPVMLVGHSQGGIVAAQLATDPAFTSRYDVTHVLTYGAPIDHLDVPAGTQVLQLQHGSDLVPRLDLGGERAIAGTPSVQPTVTLPSPGQPWQLDVNHSYTEYLSSVREQMASGSPEGQRLWDFQSTLTPYLVQPGGSASAVDVPIVRAPDER